MKIILQREVEKLGVPGDVVTVKDGYARNFLIPRGIAMPASKGATSHATRLRAKHEQTVQKARAEAEELAARLAADPLNVAARAGEDGRLFGSITVADLATRLSERAGRAIDRRQIRLAEPIRSVGAHEVAVHLHPEVDAAVTVEVVPQ